jgi:hypothetical protein
VGSEYWGTISLLSSSQHKAREIYELGSLAIAGKALSGGLEVRSDRILTPTEAFPYDEFTNAQVFLDGQKQVSYRPSKTAGLLGAILPGTALIPMMAFQVKETDDSRKAEFVAVGASWTVNLQTPVSNIGNARSLAERINARASQISSSKKDSEKAVTPVSDPFEKIEKLAALYEKGLLTQAEFEAKRSELLGSI